MKEKLQRFSLRKLSVGLASATIANFWIVSTSGTSVAFAQEEIQNQDKIVNYKYVTEGELTESELASVIKALPKNLEDDATCYYMVYSPKNIKTILPNTGISILESTLNLTGLSLAGVGLVILAFKRSKTKKDFLTSIILLSTTGSILLSSDAQALKSKILAEYNQQFTIKLGEKLPIPKEIDGYNYVGYIKTTCTKVKDSNEITKQENNKIIEQIKTENNDVKNEQPLEQRNVETKVPDNFPKVIDNNSNQEVTNIDVVTQSANIEEKVPNNFPKVVDNNSNQGATNIDVVTHSANIEEKVPNDFPKVIDNNSNQDVTNIDVVTQSANIEEKVPNDFPKVVDSVLPTPQVETTDNVDTVVIPFSEQVVFSNELFEDEQVITDGVSGVRSITTRTHRVGNQILKTEEISNVVTSSPTQKVITKGTKKRVVNVTKVPNDFPKVVDNNSNQDVTNIDVVTQSANIEEKVPDNFPKVIDNNSEQQTSVDSVLPTPQVETSDSVETVVIPFSEQVVFSNELFEDEQVVTDGVNGVRSITTRTHRVGNQILKTEEISNVVTSSPTQKVITKGTKKRVVNVTKVPNDFPKVVDNNSNQGASNIDVVTQSANIEERKPNTFPTTEEVTANVIKENLTEEITIPFEEKRVENPNLYVGEENITEGQNGTRTISKEVHKIGNETLKVNVISDSITTPKTDKVVSFGTKIDKRKLQEEYDLHPNKKLEDSYTRATNNLKTSYDNAIAEANRVLANNSATTEDVSRALATLSSARKALIASIKQKPTLDINVVTKNEDNKSTNVTFILNDPDLAATSATLSLYKGDTLVTTVNIPNINEPVTLDNLEYYEDYTLKTNLNYDIGNGQTSELQQDVEEFRLDYKKIEIKHIGSIDLYEKVGDKYVRKLALSSAPTNLTNYFVKVKSENNKEMLLEVASVIAEGDNFKVTANHPELVQDNMNSYNQNHSFTIPKVTNTSPNVFTSFTSLVDAIKANPKGTFTLGADISATEFNNTSDKYYIPTEFTGKINGQNNGKQYAIYDLEKPLFNSIKNATLTNIILKDVTIFTKDSNIGALASTSTSSTLENIAVQGNITSKNNVGGVIYEVNSNSKLNNVNFKGSIATLDLSNGENNVGGIVGKLLRNSSINKAKTEATIHTTAKNSDHKIGGLAGQIDYTATLQNSVASGKIINSIPSEKHNAQVAGIAGSTYENGRIDNVVTQVEVINGNKVHGDSSHKNANIRNVFLDETKSKGKVDTWSTNSLPTSQIYEKINSFGITATTDINNTNKFDVNYNSVPKADSSKILTYKNIEKLIPFYNKELIVYYGNKIPQTNKLATTEVVDVVAMNNNDVVIDTNTNKANINKIMVHYKDGSVEYLNVNHREDFKDTRLAEYDISSLGIIYTPEQLHNDNSTIVNRLSSSLSSMDFNSTQVAQALGTANATNKQISKLYLEESFNKVKNNSSEIIRKVLASNNSLNGSNTPASDYIVSKIENNKEAFLLGLSYLDRWYNVNYDNINSKDLTMFKFDFFGKESSSTIDSIIELGNSGYDNLLPKNQHLVYNTTIGKNKGKDDLFSLLEGYRTALLPDKTNAKWFKDNTKAYILEEKSLVAEARSKQDNATSGSDYAVEVYEKLKNPSWNHRYMLLPFLNLSEESIYAISNMSSLSIGGYERYNDTAGMTKEERIAYVRDLADKASIGQRDYADFWYKIMTETHRDKLFRNILSYDGFNYKDDARKVSWRTLNDNSTSIKDFFGPVDLWYPHKLGNGAYANGNETYFVETRILENGGWAIFAHEAIHNFDTIYFENNGRREGLGAEVYAQGFLQPTPYSDEPTLTLNTMYKYDKDSTKRLHAYNPAERYKNASDLKEYVHGMFDVIYLLDYLEATSALAKTTEEKQLWFNAIENKYIKDRDNKDTHAANVIRKITTEEANSLNSINDLIDKNIISSRTYNVGELKRNDYYTVNLFSPIYATGENKKGAPGDLTFRRTAYELLAAKGYQEGLVPYASGQYKDEALASGEKTWSGWYRKYVGLITDERIFNNVLASEYTSWNDFKKSMFNERINKKDNIKPITFEWNKKTYNINNYQELEPLMNQALNADLNYLRRRGRLHHNASVVHQLKRAIYNAYLRETDDFRESIFK